MIKVIDGSLYTELIRSGIKNLERYRSTLNDLNVFPVPDGDTGTNMVMTLRYGYDAVKDQSGSLSEISKRFSSSAVFGARGNSGVIVSQFFKGVSEAFEGVEAADITTFALSLKSGYNSAYAAVAKPVEGTMLTVIKDASEALVSSLPLDSIESAVLLFLSEAKRSLARTPELLPILKKAGVVDSGASGIVYFFEGVMMPCDERANRLIYRFAGRLNKAVLNMSAHQYLLANRAWLLLTPLSHLAFEVDAVIVEHLLQHCQQSPAIAIAVHLRLGGDETQ